MDTFRDIGSPMYNERKIARDGVFDVLNSAAESLNRGNRVYYRVTERCDEVVDLEYVRGTTPHETMSDIVRVRKDPEKERCYLFCATTTFAYEGQRSCHVERVRLGEKALAVFTSYMERIADGEILDMKGKQHEKFEKDFNAAFEPMNPVLNRMGDEDADVPALEGLASLFG